MRAVRRGVEFRLGLLHLVEGRICGLLVLSFAERLVRLFQLPACGIGLNFTGTFRVINQYANVVFENLDESAIHHQHLLVPASAIREKPWRKRAQKRSMPGENAHVAVLPRNLCLGNLFVYQQAFGRGDFQLKSICHSEN
jgi:hypothetical protein